MVSTPQATGALQARPGRDLLTAHTPEAIAELVTALLADAGLRRQIGQAGRRYVESHHDWNTAAERLEAVYRETIAGAQQALMLNQPHLSPIPE